MAKTLKPEAKLNWQKQRAGYSVTLLSILFYGTGFMIDLIDYFTHDLWFLFFINLPVLIFMIFTIFYLMKNKMSWSVLLIILYTLIILNLILSSTYRCLYEKEVADHLMTDMLLGLVIVVTSAYPLKAWWTYSFGILLSGTYVWISLYTGKNELLSNIYLIPALLIGTAFVTHTYIRLFKSSEKIVIEAKDETNKVRELLKQDKGRINNALNQLSAKIEESDISLSDDIKRIKQMINYKLPEVVLEYTEKLSSNENLFFNQLLRVNPKLTSNELKLCHMLVSNMTTKEIATNTSCTSDSIKVFRSRLRKKLNLDRSTNLVTYLKQIESQNSV